MTTHTDFASSGAAPIYDPWVGSMARNAGASVPTAQPVNNSVTPPSLALHARQVALFSAEVPAVSAASEIDRTFHPAPLPVHAAVDNPPVLAPGISLDATHGAAQLATVAHSRGRLDRARAYADRLGARMADIRAKLAAGSERQVAAAIGTAEPDAADLGPIRGEAIEVDRLHRQALAILADVEAEHARNEGDAATLFGSDGAARAKLVEAHAARDVAQDAADKAKVILDRAIAHAVTTRAKLDAARADEARHDADATARLRAALAKGEALPGADAPLDRMSPAIEDDLRAASAAVDAVGAEHVGKVAAVAAANLVVKSAVDVVLCADAETVARELLASDARTLALRVRLHTFATRRVSDWVAPAAAPRRLMPGGWYDADPSAFALPPAIRITAVIGQALASAPPPQTGGLVSTQWADEGRAWDAYATALGADPQAGPGFTDAPAIAPALSLPAPRVA